MRDRLGAWLSRLRPRPVPATAEQALRRYLETRSGDVERMPVETFVMGAVGFYRDQPVSGVVADESADMLLFQHGCYDWGQGRAFELDVTRQFAHDDDGTLSQVAATLYFTPDPALEALGAFHAWCERRADAETFAAEILNSPALEAVRARTPLRRLLRWEMV